jgi:hypothetical protein
LIGISESGQEIRNRRPSFRTHAAQVQGRSKADTFVLVLQHLGHGLEDALLLGAEMRQGPHGLLAKGWIPILEFPDPKASRLPSVDGLILCCLTRRR